MKNRFFILITALCIFLCCFTTVSYADFDGLNAPVIDGAQLLTDEEIAALSEKMSEIREDYDVDVAVYIDFSMPYDDVEHAANNAYDSMNYGMGDDASGILLYISAYPREYYFLSNGSCYESAINDRGLIYLENNVLPHLKNNDYYEAFNEFAESAKVLLEKAESGRMYNTPPTKTIAITIAAIFIIPLLLAFGLTFARIAKMNTAVKATFANNYVQNGGLNLTNSSDIFLYSTTTKSVRATSSSSGGSRRSGGGSSRGGRGGKY